MAASEYLELLDWRRSVAELFAALRTRPATAETLSWFRAQKDALFQSHPQSPIPASERSGFSGLAYWPHDADARVTAAFVAADAEQAFGAGTEIAFRRIGRLDFTIYGEAHSLGAFWIAGYAGGLFVPFRDS